MIMNAGSVLCVFSGRKIFMEAMSKTDAVQAALTALTLHDEQTGVLRSALGLLSHLMTLDRTNIVTKGGVAIAVNALQKCPHSAGVQVKPETFWMRLQYLNQNNNPISSKMYFRLGLTQ